MTRTENDLRDALHDLDEQAGRHEAPSTAGIVSRATTRRYRTDVAARRLPRWLPPLAAASVVAAVAITAVVLGTSGSTPAPAGVGASVDAASGSTVPVLPPVTPSTSSTALARSAAAAAAAAASAASSAAVLEDAATQLDAKPWTAPAAAEFFYVRTTTTTTWTSVSGTRAGRGRNDAGVPTSVPGCAGGQFVAGSGQSGSCTVNDVPHYLADAPTTPAAWDAYLERMAPGAKAGNAQGKIIVQVLHEDLTAPKAAAALLRYTATCPGLHTLAVRPVDGRQLTGVTCTSMTNGSYGLAFDASSHAFVGFVYVSPDGTQGSPAQIVRQTGIVAALGRRP